METTVVNVRHEKCDIYIGRGSIWGNPYIMKSETDRTSVIKKYAHYILMRPDLLAKIGELKGKKLGCYCAPKSCHGHVLAVLADNHNQYVNNNETIINTYLRNIK